MPTVDLQEGFDALIGGMNGGLSPHLLNQNQYAKGINVSLRGGHVKTRPRWVKLNVNIPSGRFQGASVYSLESGDRIMFVLDGILYGVKLEDLSLINWINDNQGALSSTVDRCYFVQADRYFVVQDGYTPGSWADANWPVIICEDNLIDQPARNDENLDHTAVPKGAMMAYGQGRLFVATAYVFDSAGQLRIRTNRTNFVAGDIIKAYSPEDILNFTETNYLNEGGAFKLPMSLDEIYGMNFQRNGGSGTGLGPLLVFAKRGCSAFAVDLPRDQWKDQDIGQVLFEGRSAGMVATKTIAPVNNDMFYMGLDGIRTLRFTASNTAGEGASLTNNPISYEVSEFFNDVVGLQESSSGVFVNNRYLVTTVGERLDSGEPYYKGLISYDTSVVGSQSSAAPPAFDGVWTGDKYLGLVNAEYEGKERVFAFVKEGDSNAIYYLDDDDYTEMPKCRLQTKYMNFQSPFGFKNIKHINLWLNSITGPLSVNVYIRPDDYPYWFQLLGGSLDYDKSGEKGRRSALRFSMPEIVPCDNVGRKSSLKGGFSFQVAIEWTGHMEISRCQVVAGLDSTNVYELACSMSSATQKYQTPSGAVQFDDYDYVRI